MIENTYIVGFNKVYDEYGILQFPRGEQSPLPSPLITTLVDRPAKNDLTPTSAYLTPSLIPPSPDHTPSTNLIPQPLHHTPSFPRLPPSPSPHPTPNEPPHLTQTLPPTLSDPLSPNVTPPTHLSSQPSPQSPNLIHSRSLRHLSPSARVDYILASLSSSRIAPLMDGRSSPHSQVAPLKVSDPSSVPSVSDVSGWVSELSGGGERMEEEKRTGGILEGEVSQAGKAHGVPGGEVDGRPDAPKEMSAVESEKSGVSEVNQVSEASPVDEVRELSQTGGGECGASKGFSSISEVIGVTGLSLSASGVSERGEVTEVTGLSGASGVSGVSGISLPANSGASFRHSLFGWGEDRYTVREFKPILDELREAVLQGKATVERAHLLLGVITLLTHRFCIFVTKKKKVCRLLGAHWVYVVEKALLLPLHPVRSPSLTQPNTLASLTASETKTAEAKYVQSITTFLQTGGFHFSYTTDLSVNLQERCVGAAANKGDQKGRLFGEEYCWNAHLLAPLLAAVYKDEVWAPPTSPRPPHSSHIHLSCQSSQPTHSRSTPPIHGKARWRSVPLVHGAHPLRHWSTPLIQGFVASAQCSCYGRYFEIALISRRSPHFAGTRYRKRGANSLGQCANCVESEQIVYDGSVSDAVTSFTQLRASVPLLWTQSGGGVGGATALVGGRPAVQFPLGDSNHTVTRRHFGRLMERYGSPIFAVNLLKKVPHVTQVTIESTLYFPSLNCNGRLLKRWIIKQKNLTYHGSSVHLIVIDDVQFLILVLTRHQDQQQYGLHT
eukprot:GHVN01008456.1.p1 GENE.GHVN01008456.1~~GHVN01008456.1.p1  ORF type:complete len:779 (-),score=218.15 GHVN01008456.1:134-2470(-)